MKLVILLSLLCIVDAIHSRAGRINHDSQKTVEGQGKVVSLPVHRHPTIRQQLMEGGTWSSVRKESHKNFLRNKNSAPINDYYDTIYRVYIGQGQPTQYFYVYMDTGSSDYWLIDSSCQEQACNGIGSNQHQKFVAAYSSTFINNGSNVNIDYGTGFMTGYLGYDVVNLGDLEYPTQGFGLATNLSSNWGNLPVSGLIGMAWPQLSSFGVTPVMQNLLNQLAQPIFTTWLRSYNDIVQNVDGGQLTLGGYDSDHCAPTINYVPVSSQQFWQFTLTGWGFGASLAGFQSQQAILDTGTSFLMGPPAVVQQIASVAQATWDDDNGLYWIDCNTQDLPNLILNIGGNSYAVTPDHYVVVWQKTITSKKCVLAILDMESFGWNLSWLLGDPFLNHYCNVYDIGNSRIGIAEKTVA